MIRLGALTSESILTPSRSLAERVQREWLFCRGKISVNHHGVSRFLNKRANSGLARLLNDAKKKVGIKRNNGCLLWTSKMWCTYKNPMVLLKAMRLLKETFRYKVFLINTVSENVMLGECAACSREFLQGIRTMGLAGDVLSLGNIEHENMFE